MVLYEVQLLMESGALDKALKHMEEFKTYISDTLAYEEIKGERREMIRNYQKRVEMKRHCILGYK